MQGEADKIAASIRLNYYDPNNTKNFGVVVWRESIRPESFSIQEIQSIWSGEINPSTAKGFVDNVWSNTNISKFQKLSFLYSVIETNSKNSLLAANRAAYLLADELHAKYNPSFEYSDIESKWAKWIKTNSISSTTTNTPPQTKP